MRRILSYGTDYTVEVSGDVDSAGRILKVTPLKPLTPSTGATNIGYIVLVTNNLTDPMLLRRAMIEDTLEGAKATRYGHAARHLLECRGLEAGIGDHGGFETHEAFVARLRARHGRKAGFWSRVEELGGASGRR